MRTESFPTHTLIWKPDHISCTCSCFVKAPPNNPAGDDRVYPFRASLSDAGDKVDVTVSQLLDADSVASQRYSFLVQVSYN